MSFTIKDVAKNVDISEQGLYKRIKSNYDEYIQKGYIELNQVEQPNGTTKKQIFITKEGLQDLLKTKQLRKEADFERFNEVLNQPTKPKLSGLNQVEQPLNQPTKPKNDKPASNEYIELLNQTITDLKTENKRLNEKLEKQEARFDEKLEKQKQEFKEQYDKQQEAYKNTIDKLLNNVNIIMQRLPEPPLENMQDHNTTTIIDKPITTEEVEAEQKGIKSFFKRIFKGG